MLSVKQGDIKYHFLSLWYDSTWDWTQVYRIISEHSNHYSFGLIEMVTWNHIIVCNISILDEIIQLYANYLYDIRILDTV